MVLSVAAVVLGLTAAGVAPVGASSTSPHGVTEASAVTITRDSTGVAHITAADFKALGYGEAWAFAQDNFCSLAQDFVTVTGERSRYFGPNGESISYATGAEDTNLASDLFWQSVISSGIIAKEMGETPPNGPLPQVRQMYAGFVDGYNAYLASGRLNDPTCAGRPWVHPITVADMFLRALQFGTEASSGQLITAEVDATPPTPGAVGTAAKAPSKLELAAAANELRERASSASGSNGIGIGSTDTANGDGMVLANPHQPWRGTDKFWMAQLTVPGQYDVEGGVVYGFPLIAIGFNQGLAWTHTVATDLRFTFFQLNLVPGHPTSYYLDGKAQQMQRETVRVDTGHRMVTHTFYSTRWGTVIDEPALGLGWTTTTAFTLDDVDITGSARFANEYLRMGQSTSVNGLLSVESTYLAVPIFNTIAADDTGHTLYADVGSTPNVPLSLITSSCLPPGIAQQLYAEAGLITLDGSRSACAWRTSPGTPIPGIFNASQLPHTIRTDYVENSNDSYWLANPTAPFPAFSPIIGDIDTEQGLRTRQGNQMIAGRVAGTDGLGPPKFTLPTLQAMWQSDRSYLAQLVLKPLVAACRTTPTVTASNGTKVNLTPACAALAGYDGTGKLNAAGGWLFSEWYVRAPITGFWTVPFNVKAPLTTPRGLDTSDPAVLTALADAVLSLRSHHIPLDASYGTVQYFAVGKLRIPIPGCDSGCFNVISAADGTGSGATADAYGEVYDGASLVMTTELTGHGPLSEGIVTYSQATNPKSPYYGRMTKLFSEGKWVQLPYTEGQLAQDRNTSTSTLYAP